MKGLTIDETISCVREAVRDVLDEDFHPHVRI